MTRRRIALLFLLFASVAGCASKRAGLSPGLAALPVLKLPPGVYETIIDSLLVGFQVDYAVVADETQICYDFEDRHTAFPGYFETLSSASKEAHRDCNRKGDEEYRIPVDSLRAHIPVRARSWLNSYEADMMHPTIFLSRPGQDSGGSVLVVAGGYYCGMLCERSDLFIFRRRGGEWVLESHWTMFVS